MKNKQLALQYGVGEATISDILKEKQHFLALEPNDYTASLRRQRSSKFPTIEQALAIWIDQATNDNQTLPGHVVIAKAAAFAERFEIQDFKGSHGWFDRFKKRYNVREYIRHGEANSAPLADLPQHRKDLQDLLRAWKIWIMFLIATKQDFIGNWNPPRHLHVIQFQEQKHQRIGLQYYSHAMRQEPGSFRQSLSINTRTQGVW